MTFKMKFCRFCLKLAGWKIEGEMPEGIHKSVMVVAPHTSYWDAFAGKFVLGALGARHKMLGKKELFTFPLGPFMRMFGIVPIRGIKGVNSITMAVGLLNETKEDLHLVICPEGGFAPTTNWGMGFLAMARRAGVPVLWGYVDFGHKKGGIKGYITDLEDETTVVETMAKVYDGVIGKYPDRFLLPVPRTRK